MEAPQTRTRGAEGMTRKKGKERPIQFRVTAEQRQALEEAADRDVDTMSNFVRRAVLKAIGWRPVRDLKKSNGDDQGNTTA